MRDLIDRQRAIEHLKMRLNESAINNVGAMVNCDKVFEDIADNRIETWLSELPSAEKRGKRGWWKKWTRYTIAPDYEAVAYEYTCSECGAEHRPTYDYCPSCGSRNERDK